MLSPRGVACSKANVPLVLTQTFVVPSRIFIRHQANRDTKLCRDCLRKFNRYTAELAISSARHENGIGGYQGSAKLALGGKPFSSVLGVRLIPCGAAQESDECAEAYFGDYWP